VIAMPATCDDPFGLVLGGTAHALVSALDLLGLDLDSLIKRDQREGINPT
jgi:hypothetical protein